MKLSIITINYNNLNGLKKTVDSVLSQTWRDFEWIIVDGGSTDGSKEYIETLAQSLSEGTAIDRVQWNVERFSLLGFTAEDLKENTFESVPDQSSNRTSSIVHRQSYIANPPQRLLWCSEPDKGVYNAMNKGIAMSNGIYLQFLNSGDAYYNQESLQKVFDVWKESDIIYGDVLRVGNGLEQIEKKNKKLSLSFFIQSSLCHQAALIKNELIKKCGYRDDYIICSDWQRFFEWFVDGRSFYYIGFVMIRYDVTGISGKNLEFNRNERLRWLEEFTKENGISLVLEIERLTVFEKTMETFEHREVDRLIRRGHFRKKLITIILNALCTLDKFFGLY